MKLAEEISRDGQNACDVSFFENFYDFVHTFAVGPKTPEPWNFLRRQHDAVDAFMTMITFCPKEQDELWRKWHTSLSRFFEIKLDQKVETIYKCKCDVMLGTTEKKARY